MRKFLTLLLMTISTTIFAQPLNEIYGVKPKVGGACTFRSVQELDGVLMTIKMKKNYDWIISNCKEYKAVVENKYPDRLRREHRLDISIYAAIKPCYSEKDVDLIMAVSQPQSSVKSCSFRTNDLAVGSVMNLLANYN